MTRQFAGRSAALGLLLLSLCSGEVQAERLQLTNGLEVRGYVVGHDKGHYQVRIGSYTKQIADSQVKAIVDDDAAPPAMTPAVATPVTGAQPAPSAGLDASALQSLLGAGGGGLDLSKLVGGGSGGLDLSKLLGGGGGSGGLDLSQLMGALSAGGGAGGGGVGSLGQMAEKMKDPAFQQQFLAHIENMNAHGPNPGGATPYIGILKGLFAQLNTKVQAEAVRASAPVAGKTGAAR